MKKDDVKGANGAASLNGTTTKTAATAPATAANSSTPKTEQAKPEPSKPAAEVKEAQPRSLNEIFKQQDKLSDLREKWGTLDLTQKKLDSFRFGSDKQRDELRVSDGRGSDFVTTNSDVITKVVELLKKEVAAKVAEVEAEIQAAA